MMIRFFKKIIAWITILIFPLFSFWSITVANSEIQGRNFQNELEQSTKGLNFDSGPSIKGTDGVGKFILDLLDTIKPIVILVGVLMAFFGAYKIMGSEDPAKTKEGVGYVIAGVVGIIIMVSAKFIGYTLVNDVIVTNNDEVDGLTMANNLYEILFLPFIKIAIYLSAWFLFFVLAARVFSFLFSSDEGTKAKAWGMILWAVIGIAIILLSKELVEAIFGKRSAVINHEANNLGDLGNALLEQDFQSSLPLAYTIINWVMGLTALVILIMIIVQTVQMITKPDDTELITKLKKTLIYVFVGVIIIGAWYFISNFLILDGQS